MNNRDNKSETGSFLTIAKVKDIVIIAFIVIVSWKLLNSNITIDIKEFGFSDLISLILAIFAMSLSIAFYFKANDTSNFFYDNVYKFTKDTSEILGRIEAGFGEKLRHIDEGYVGLRNKFDQIPIDIKETENKIENEEKEIQQIADDRNKIIADLVEKAKIKDEEKEKLLSEIKSKDEAYSQARRELFMLKRNLDDVELENNDIPERLERYIANKAIDLFGSRCTECDIKKNYDKFNNILHEDAREEMKEFDLIDKHNELTRKGARFISRIIRKYRNITNQRSERDTHMLRR
ncbi:hypothetical protein [Sulfurimonas sp.]|uniref:hypothetical protein n=1 Tax=Sulfurimonas sp. TaxID=2022749 RepID=UPI00261AAB27|nr:hypothetical protein [Sulfurimonas sp.]MDD3856288.1 hypothetical protein [Sulfurimonas sp.]